MKSKRKIKSVAHLPLIVHEINFRSCPNLLAKIRGVFGKEKARQANARRARLKIAV
jgi:hypothetical protein